MKRKVKRVYIAGPYTKGDMNHNIRQTLQAADEVIKLGFSPFIPHLYFFVELGDYRHHYETWMKIDQDFLESCEACIRLDGDSSGADRETEWCFSHNVPVFTLEGFKSAVVQGKIENG